MGTSTLHVIGPPGWVAEEFRRGLAEGRDRAPNGAVTNVVAHDGLSPVEDIGEEDAIWSSPGALIALDDWRRRHGLPPLQLTAPAADAITHLPYPLTRHRVLVARAGDIISGRAFDGTIPGSPPNASCPADRPADPLSDDDDSLSDDSPFSGSFSALDERPWSRVASGRVSAFRAARRDVDELRRDLVRAHAPADSLIEVAGNVEGLVEEWCAVVDPATGTAVACSGACVHPTPGGMDVVTVFDGARFDSGHREAVLDAAAATARTLAPTRALAAGSATDEHRIPPPPVSLLLGIPVDTATPVVLEIDPVWCTTPYPFGRDGMEAFVGAIARCRIDSSPAGDSVGDGSFVWVPDPWMTREFSRRYRGFDPVRGFNPAGSGD